MKKRNKVSGRGVESTRSLEMKFKGLYQRASEGTLSEFELKMFKGIEKSLGEKGYFNSNRNIRRRRPLFWGRQ